MLGARVPENGARNRPAWTRIEHGRTTTPPGQDIEHCVLRRCPRGGCPNVEETPNRLGPTASSTFFIAEGCAGDRDPFPAARSCAHRDPATAYDSAVSHLREPILLLFLDVVLDVLDQDGRLRIEALVAGASSTAPSPADPRRGAPRRTRGRRPRVWGTDLRTSGYMHSFSRYVCTVSASMI